MPGILSRIGHYAIAKGVVMAAGLVSFPILTRVLSPAEYGIMGLVITLLNLTIGVSKLGLQFSTVRLWAQYDEGDEGRQRFILSFFCATLLAGLAVVLLYDVVTAVLRPWIGAELTFFILLSSPLVAVRALSAFGHALLNARQWSRPYAVFEVLNAYAAMILAVLGATVIIGGLKGYYVGLLSGEGLILVALMIYILRGTRLTRANLSFSMVREAVLFGVPMAIYEMAGVLFFTGDRFIILWLAGKSRLGFYTVAHNLSMYIHMLFAMPVMMTVTPAATSLYEKEGPAAASEFLGRAFRWFFLFAGVAVAGMTAIRHDLIDLLASEKFMPGADMVPILLAGLLMSGAREILGCGMFLKKRPWLMAGLLILGAGFNAGLNIVLIPLLNIEGAALATLVAQLAMVLAFWVLGSRLVSVSLDLLSLGKYTLCAAIMAVALYYVDPGPGALRLVLRMGIGALIFGGILLALDSEARAMAAKVMRKLRG